MIKAVIFDLDGVITDTAPLHYKSWKKVVKDFSIDDLPINYLDQLRGVSRTDSLEIILKDFSVSISDEVFNETLERKNLIYKELIKDLTEEDILPGIKPFMVGLKENNFKIALGSASYNAINILDKLNLSKYFDALVDPALIKNSKPFPDIFNKGIEMLNLKPNECVVIEDSKVGIDAAKAAGCKNVGINVDGDIRLNSTSELKVEVIKKFN